MLDTPEEPELTYGTDPTPAPPAVSPAPTTQAPSQQVPLTGPAAIAHALRRLDLNKVEEEQRAIIRKGQVSKRPAAVHALNTIEGLRRNKLKPDQLMISRIPVIPPAFRPFSVAGDTFVAGDANELYGDVLKLRDAHQANRELFGEEGSYDSLYDLYRATKALYGYGEPVSTKVQSRGVVGFLQHVSGKSGPKFCYDADTEILTREGWVKFPALPEGVEVGTINPHSLDFEWQKPSNYLHADYEGPMLHWANRRTDLLVTPNHRMWLRWRSKGQTLTDANIRTGWGVYEADTIRDKRQRRWYQTAAAGWQGSSWQPACVAHWPAELFARWLGWWLAEGDVHTDRTVATIWQTQAYPDYCEELHNLMQDLRNVGEQAGAIPHRKGGVLIGWGFRVKSAHALCAWLSEECSLGSNHKRIPRSILDWPVELLQLLLTAYLRGDGDARPPYQKKNSNCPTHKFRNRITDKHNRFSTTSPGLFGDIAEVCLKLGLTVVRDKDYPHLREKRARDLGLDPANMAELFRGSIIGRWNCVDEKAAKTVNYKGTIHCCTTPNGLLVVRRNGKQVISGNSMVQRKLISKPQDQVARGTISINPELTMDQIGLPVTMAWASYRDHVIRRLVRSGVNRIDAVRHVRDQTPLALRALQAEVKERPVIYSRAPAWHKYNSIAGWPELVDGDTIQINPLVTTGMNADFNGDNQQAKILLLLETDKHKGHHNLDLRSRIHPSMVGDMIAKQVIPSFNTTTHDLYLLDLQDFPHGALQGHNPNGRQGPIDFFHPLAGTKVIAFEEATNTPVWADVASYSIHYGREVEIVDLSNGRQITTDDDPRAVYGIDPAQGPLLRRFTPTQALEFGVLVPCVRDVTAACQHLGKLETVAVCGEADTVWRQLPLTWDFGYLLGAIAGDGWWDKRDYNGIRNVYLSDLQGYNAARVHQVLSDLFGSVSWRRQEFLKADHPERYGDTVRHTYTFDGSEFFTEFLSKWLGGEATENSTGSGAKHLPDFFLLSPREFREGMLNGLIDTDGSISVSEAKGKPQLMCNATSTSLRLASDIKFLCMTLGIQASLGFSKMTTRGNASWIVNLSTVDVKRLALFDRLASPWKRDAYLNTPVAEDNTSQVFDKVPVWRTLFDRVAADLTCPKITGAERKTLTREELADRLEAQNFYIQWWKAKKEGLVSRSFARRLYDRLQTLQAQGEEIRQQALMDLRQGDSTASPERVGLWRQAIRITCPKQDTPDRYQEALKVYGRLNRPLAQGVLSDATRNSLIEWLTTTTPYRNAASTEEFYQWFRLFVAREGVGWAQVVKVQRTGIREDGYDLTVPGYETFMSADGIILSNTVNVHVPALPETVTEAKEKLMASKMLFSIRDQEDVVPKLKHEQVLGLYTAQKRPAKQVHNFATREEALDAIRKGRVSLADELLINGKP